MLVTSPGALASALPPSQRGLGVEQTWHRGPGISVLLSPPIPNLVEGEGRTVPPPGTALFGLVAPLPRANSHAMRFSAFFNMFPDCATITRQRDIIPPSKTQLHRYCVLPSPSPWQARSHFLSLWVCLFWTLHVSGAVRHVALCGLLLSITTGCSENPLSVSLVPPVCLTPFSVPKARESLSCFWFSSL